MEFLENPLIIKNLNEYKSSDLLRSLTKEIVEYPISMNGKWFIKFDQSGYLIGCFYFGINELTEHTECYVELFVDDNTKISVDAMNQILYEIEITVTREKIYLDFLRFHTIFKNKTSLIQRNKIIENLGFRETCTVIEKELGENLYNKEMKLIKHKDNLTIREFKDEDQEHVLECIIKSHFLFFEGEGLIQENEFNRIRENIKCYYTPLKTDKRFIYIVEKDNKFIGHITFEVNNEKSTLIDIYVIEEFQGRGYTKELSRVLELYNFQLGIKYIEGTVGPNETTDILDNLVENGWKIKSRYYSKKV